MARLGLVSLAFLPVVFAVGCGEGVTAVRPAVVRPAAVADLELAAEAVGLQPEGGLPEKVRLTLRNQGGAPVTLMFPRPMVSGVQPPRGEEMPMPVLSLSLKDAAGHEETVVYTDPRRKSWPRAVGMTLHPDAAWTGEYPLKAFYFWSSAGPDVEGDFTRYFWRGDQPVSLVAAMILGKDQAVRSKPLVLQCKYEDRLFRK
jgi:hypothetical protein